MKWMLLLTAVMLASCTALAADAKQPVLSKEDWVCAQATSAAIQPSLTHAGVIDQNKVDNKASEITLLAKQPMPHDTSRSVFLITLHETSGRKVTFVTSTSTAEGECPYDDPKAYIVSKEL